MTITNAIRVRTVGPIQITTRVRVLSKMYGVSRCKGGSIRIDTGRTVRYIKTKPRKFWNLNFQSRSAY